MSSTARLWRCDRWKSIRPTTRSRNTACELTKRFKKIVREAGREEQVCATLRLVQGGFGNPHLHAGLSIRKLGKSLYECRTSLTWRLLFEAQKGIHTFDFAGDDDEVLNYLRGHL